MSAKSHRLAELCQHVEAIRPHAQAWIQLLEAYRDALPHDRPPTPEDPDGCSDRSYVDHEINAMRRDLGALLTVDLVNLAA